MAKKLGVDPRRPGGVPPLSAYAYQRSVSLPLATIDDPNSLTYKRTVNRPCNERNPLLLNYNHLLYMLYDFSRSGHQSGH